MGKRQIALTGIDGFDDFWRVYPKKEAKKDAQKAWTQLHPSLTLQQQILNALSWQRMKPQWLKDDGAYVPNAATWLRGERWTDERPSIPALSEQTVKTLRAIYG